MEEVKKEASEISAPIQSAPQSTTETPAVVTAKAEITPPEAELIDIEYLSKLQLRVAKIISAEALPKSNKLLKLQISLGTEGERQILAGIAKHYTPESLVGRKIVVVANLKPAKLMGETSNGMLLAADAGEKVILLNPEQETPEGAKVR